MEESTPWLQMLSGLSLAYSGKFSASLDISVQIFPFQHPYQASFDRLWIHVKTKWKFLVFYFPLEFWDTFIDFRFSWQQRSMTWTVVSVICDKLHKFVFRIQFFYVLCSHCLPLMLFLAFKKENISMEKAEQKARSKISRSDVFMLF